MSYNIQLNQTDTTYFAVVVGKRVSELSVNFLYEPIIFDSLSSFSNTVLVVIIVVIVVIIVIVWRSIKNKRKSEFKGNNFYKLNN
jgi:tetrahydromethanopterin S-methyltransferase subunit E